ncbi:MAG TPA: lytic transglycosylase domain-containing protein [Thermoanaerobaculia bacterium]|nr:lytic transglycosylase domain-containing protein [Thermoanaerobaculia bacterium]
MRRKRRKQLLASAGAILVVIGAALLIHRDANEHRQHQREAAVVHRAPEAPPDLEKLRPAFAAGLAALSRKNGAEAAKQFASFTFGGRAVEEYRLWFLAQAQQMAKDHPHARATLAQLWARDPRGVDHDDAGAALASLYAEAGDTGHAFETELEVGDAAARMNAMQAALAQGDAGGILFAARTLAIKNPASAPAGDAVAVVQSLTSLAPDRPIKLTAMERMERAVSFLRDGDPQNCFDEIALMEQFGVPADLKLPVQLNKGLALQQLRRFDDSNKLLEPLAGGPHRIAIPAIYFSARNYRILAASINPMVNKVVTVRQKVKVGKKTRIRKVKKTVQLVDLAKKAKKESYEALFVRRLKDLLPLPLADDVRVQVLGALMAAAEGKNQDAYERELIPQLAKIDPSQEAGLQHFWDKAWAAYARGDLNGAVEQMTFIRDNYRNPNVKRQAAYWIARSIERLGRKEEAAAMYRNLSSAPYDDVYAKFAESRGAPHATATNNPLTMNRPDWRDIAEQNMPLELRLAYELTALADVRDARAEILKNRTRKNQPYADALMAELYNYSGDWLSMLRALRSAFPQIATVEQDSVPPYFLKMYYPVRYQTLIRKYSRKNGLDPHLVMGLINQESFYNPRTKSHAGAIGLMQLMPATGKELGGQIFGRFDVKRLDNPEVNIELGTMHFRFLVDLFGGKTELAIASYNAGQGNVAKWRRAAPSKPMDEFLESIPFAETRNYVKRVTMLSAAYARMVE